MSEVSCPSSLIQISILSAVGTGVGVWEQWSDRPLRACKGEFGAKISFPGGPGSAEIQQLVSAGASEGAGWNLTCFHPSVTREWIFWLLPSQRPEFIVQRLIDLASSTDLEGTLKWSQ